MRRKKKVKVWNLLHSVKYHLSKGFNQKKHYKESSSHDERMKVKDLSLNYPKQEKLFLDDKQFGKMVAELRSHTHISRVKNSKYHTIRTKHTSEDNEKQFKRREKILEYADKKGLSEKETDQWLKVKL